MPKGNKVNSKFYRSKDVDVKTLHRVCHTLKGQSFMGFYDIGLKALELETYFKAKLENTQVNEINVEAILTEIEKLIVVHVIPSKEGIMDLAYAGMTSV